MGDDGAVDKTMREGELGGELETAMARLAAAFGPARACRIADEVIAEFRAAIPTDTEEARARRRARVRRPRG